MKETIAELFKNPLIEEDDFFYQGIDCISHKISEDPKWGVAYFHWGRVEFDHKTIHVIKPTTGRTIYSDVMNTLDSSHFMSYTGNPITAFTPELFELNDGWYFSSDDSRNNVQMSSWKEGDDIWLGIVPITAESEPITDLQFVWMTDEGFSEKRSFNSSPILSGGHEMVSQPVKKLDKISNLLINIERGDTFAQINKFTGIDDIKGPQMIFVPIQRKERYIDYSE